MPITHRTHSSHLIILGCLTALFATPLMGQVQVDYTDGQTNATNYNVSGAGSTITLSISSGIATQSGIVSGRGSLLKASAGTVILSATNAYTGGTTLSAGTLEVAASGTISHFSSTITIGTQVGNEATLLINSGTVNSANGILGNTNGASGVVMVSGGTWTNGGDLTAGNLGTGALTLSSGAVRSSNGFLGFGTGSTGTATVTGGVWTNSSQLVVGNSGTGTLTLTGGTVTNTDGLLGNAAGSTGTTTVSGLGSRWMNSQDINVGYSGTGTLFVLNGGQVTSHNGLVGTNSGSIGRVIVDGEHSSWYMFGDLLVDTGGSGSLVISHGGVVTNSAGIIASATNDLGTVTVDGVGSRWVNNGDVIVGGDGPGVLSILNGGEVDVNSTNQLVTLGQNAGGRGTLNIGNGGTSGTLNALEVRGGAGTAVVNFSQTDSFTFTPTLTGGLSVNQIGPGTTTLAVAESYTGSTNVLGGTLRLAFGGVSADILPSTTDLTIGSGTLQLSGEGTQTVNSLSTGISTAGRIVMDVNETLDLGSLSSVGRFAALNFNTAAGGADGDTAGSGVIVLGGQTSGDVISSRFTVTDSTGFGLATVDGNDQIIRLTTTALLPASGANTGTDYRIDNNAGDNLTAGSATLVVTASQPANSITVDTSATAGTLTLASGVVLSSDVWNFGGNGSHGYEITGSASGAGITSASSNGMLQINNYNTAPVTISATILDNDASGLRVAGPGTTILSGANTYTGDTLVSSGVLEVASTGSITSNLTTTIAGEMGDYAQFNLHGIVTDFSGVLGDGAGATGITHVGPGGIWLNNGPLTIGQSGTGVLNIGTGRSLLNGRGVDGVVTSSDLYLGVNAGSSGTVTLLNRSTLGVDGDLIVGGDGTGVLSLTGSSIVTVGRSLGTVTLGAQGTLNIGTGADAGLLQAGYVYGVSGSLVSYNFNALGRQPFSNPILENALSVVKLGGGTLAFTEQQSYTGRTTVAAGNLTLGFFSVSRDILFSSTALTMAGGTLQLSGEGFQTVNGLTTTANTGSKIKTDFGDKLTLGALTALGSGSALNFDTSAGGSDGASVNGNIIVLTGQTAGSVINPGFTVTDSTGFGLATVNASDDIIRITSTDLLPHTSADAGTDYRIDNNAGNSATAGSSSLEITASQTARSITVDTFATAGILKLDPAVVLSSDVWNFGGINNHSYAITSSDADAGIRSATAGGMLQINNYNDAPVTISAPILDNSGSGLRVGGTSTTLLTGTDTYIGDTIVNSGTLFINGDHTAATGAVTVQSAATLSGVGTLGSTIHVQNGGILAPGNFLGLGTLNGTTATFDTSSIFHLQGGSTLMTTLHLSGDVTIAPDALIYISTSSTLTQSSYTLMTAASGLDGSHPFSLANNTYLPSGYKLVYTGTELDLVAAAPAVAYWTHKISSDWSGLSSGSSNWATSIDGQTDTNALPDTPTDVTFAAQSVIGGITSANLDIDATINSLTIIRDTAIDSTGTHTLTVNTTTTVNSELAIDSGVTLIGKGALTIGSEGTLTGNGAVHMAADQNIFANGAITVPAPPLIFFFPPPAEVLSLTTSGTGAIVMGANSSIHISLNTGAGLGDNTAIGTAAGVLNLHGTLDATAGGTLVLENPTAMTGYAGGDQWKVFELNNGAGTITGHLALNDSAVGLTTGFVGSFDQTTGIYSIADHRPEMTAQSSGLPMSNAEGISVLSGVQTSTNDINNHLFNLRNGGGEEDGPDGSIASSIDDGVVVGQGDGPEDPIAKRIKRTRQWEVFTTVNYGNVRLNPISNQSGVQVDSWASSVGIERHLSRGLSLGFAVTFLQSTQTYTGGLGKLDLEGPTLSAYLSYVKKSFWGSLLYSFGDYDLGSQRNPGLGLPVASGGTNAYTNVVQYNTGWNFRFQNNTLVTGPFAGIDYLHGTVDAYNETGGGLGALHYNKQTFESLVTRVGWSLSKKFETEWASITPQLRLSYERQNLKNNGTSVNLINAPFSAVGGNQSPGQDYMVIGTGVNFQFSPDFSMMLGYQTQIFRNNLSAHFGSVRFGYKF